MRRLVLGTHVVITKQTTQHGKKLVRIVQVLADLARARVGLTHFQSPSPLRGTQRCPESDQHIHFMLETLRSLPERLEQRQPVTQVTKGFYMGGAFGGALPSAIPIVDRL